MDRAPYKLRDDIIKRDHKLLKMLSSGSKKIRVKKKPKK